MLEIIIPGLEYFDEVKEEFIQTLDTTITLEHSLLSISKWESKWCKPFISKEPKTVDEIIGYTQCMSTDESIPQEVYERLTEHNLTQINDYINAPMTATTINNVNSKPSNEIITSEVIYYWMVSYNIPFECQEWHLNRLLMLIKVCNAKNSKPTKMSKEDIMARNRRLNAERRAKMNSKG